MSIIRADSIKNRAGDGAPDFPNGITVTGIVTATTLNQNITGLSTFNGNIDLNGDLDVSGNISIGGTLTYEDVTNIDSVGLITARNGISVSSGGLKVLAGGSNFNDTITGTATTATTITVSSDTTDTLCFPIFTNTGVGNNGPKVNTSKLSFNSSSGALSATSFVGDGSQLTNVGFTTEALTTAGATVTLDLSKDDHKITKSGTYTITCTGGSEGSSHTVRIVNSGTSNVSFSNYFLFPSGGTPALPTASGGISMISFTVHRAGAVGINTQLLAGASVNFS